MLARLVDLSAEAQAKAVRGIESIFFLTSSRQTFTSEVEKRRFIKNYLSEYLRGHREYIWLALEDAQTPVLGYLTGCPDSEKAISQFELRIPAYLLFKQQFTRFPAHLHINVHPLAQGRGLGRQLILAFESQLRERNCPGIHLVTDARSDNVRFYSALGFQEIDRRPLGSVELVCLAKDL